MKKYSILFLVFFYSLFSSGQGYDNPHHCLMEANSFAFGMGVPYNLTQNAPGINFRAYYLLNERWCIGPEFSHFTFEEGTAYDFDLVAHYIIETPWLGVYPVAGVNATSPNQSGSELQYGVVYGAGIHRNYRHLTYFLETTRVELNDPELFVTGGVLIRFGKRN